MDYVNVYYRPIKKNTEEGIQYKDEPGDLLHICLSEVTFHIDF